ncbi:MAG: hypothetical protein AVDCRST_MAG08-306 [uncultured Acetobacteraceae bacterium]|uniref:Uncharacterized protein n=1 Tax=uncultured Acetobacteraceae bacterium TaxID=169975 RepID=A0A6J4H667_9PROT|nr:MAG: hypothetical protein AVDCRST_MAG08-306 [uncultured Acetobacteraceae bacterium]
MREAARTGRCRAAVAAASWNGSYRPFRDDQFQWFRVAESAYDTFAFTAAAR